MTDTLVNSVADYLGYTVDQVIELSKKAPGTYRKYKIPKKKSGLRTIHHPSKQTKSLQYALIENFLSKLPIHNCAAAYVRNIKSPLLKNALLHSHYRYSVRIDFSDFFHSITSDDLFNQIDRHKITLSAFEREFIKDSLFIKAGNNRRELAIGAPSSPIVSNIVMFTLDESINAIANSITNPVAYSRYADDIVFSTNLVGGCRTFYESLRSILNSTTSPRLIINQTKTNFASRASRRVITGLFVQPDGRVSLGRQNKRFVRKLLFDLQNKRLEPEKQAYLSGYLAFTLDVEPDFFNRLVLKYGADLLEQALNSRQ